MRKDRSIRLRLGSEDASAAVEFSLIGPLFLVVMFAVISFSVVTLTYSSLQQLVAEAARATIAGLSDQERDQIARSSITSNALTYALIDPSKISIKTTGSVSGASSSAYTITITYDFSGSFVFSLPGTSALLSRNLVRSSTVIIGGFQS
jgi:Flp pilus assembly protein TadG